MATIKFIEASFCKPEFFLLGNENKLKISGTNIVIGEWEMVEKEFSTISGSEIITVKERYYTAGIPYFGRFFASTRKELKEKLAKATQTKSFSYKVQ